MKKISFLLMAFGLMMVTSCTKSDFDNIAYMDTVKENYNDLFTLTFGEIAPGHDWGFSASTGNRGAAMRGIVDMWPNDQIKDHSCDWTDKFEFSLPADAVDVTDPSADKNNKKNFYVPEGYEGKIENFSIPDGGALYNYGHITGISGFNCNGKVTFYNAGTFENFWANGSSDHTVINTGTFITEEFQNIKELYNKGTLVLTGSEKTETQYPDWNNYKPVEVTIPAGADIPNRMQIYSLTDVEVPVDGDFKAACDIHGTLKATGTLKLQNSETQYVCAVVVTGKDGGKGVLDMTEGHLVTSYIKADEITFDGSHIWLEEEAHIEAGKISMPNSASEIYGHEGSFALVEADDFYFDNKNGFAETFSDNIYFTVGGTIYFTLHISGDKDLSFANAAEFLNSQYGAGLESRINYESGKTVTGNPGCGAEYSFNVPDDDDDPDPTPEPEPTPDPDEPTEIVYAKRIIAEDLAAGQFNADFDFNDVVFDAVVKVENGRYIGYVKVLAAGGTLPLYIGQVDADHEVHGLFGEKTGTMINTGTNLSKDVDKEPTIDGIDLGPATEGTDENTLVRKINDIPVYVVSSARGTYLLETEIGAYPPKAPMKIAVSTDYKWTKERQPVNKAYSTFENYVQTGSPTNWYDASNIQHSDLIYSK